MNGQPSPAPTNRRTRRLKTVVLIFVAFIAVYFAYHHSLSLSIRQRIDSIHQAGFPASCAVLDKWYLQPTAGENAADVYSNAFVHYQMWTNNAAQFSVPADARDTNKYSSIPRSRRDILPIVGMATLPSRTEPLTPEMQKLVADYLSDNAESLRLLHEASSMKTCRYPIDLTKGSSTLLPHLNSLRQAARLLELQAIQFTQEQQPQPAVDSVVASMGVSQSLNQEPILISFLVNVACQGITLNNLERMLNRLPLSDDELSKLDAAIQESENQQAFTRAFVGERCIGLDAFRGLRTGKIPIEQIGGNETSFWPRSLIAIYSATGLFDQDEEAYLDMMGEYVTATQLPPLENVSTFHDVGGKWEHLTRWRVISRMLLPALDQMGVKATRCTAKIRTAKTALAIERYRLANSKLPAQLSDLVPTFLPAVPSDPFDGQPLRYKALAKGYVVYSVGDDREDNGGTEVNSKGYVPGTDITFTIER